MILSVSMTRGTVSGEQDSSCSSLNYSTGYYVKESVMPYE